MPKTLATLALCLLLSACGDDEKATGAGGAKGVTGGGSAAPAKGATYAAAVEAGPPVPSGWPEAAERMLASEAGNAPTPFTAAQIRAGCGPQSRRIMRMTQPGQQPTHSLWTFTDQTDTGVTAHQAVCDEKGTETGDKNSTAATWADLQRHASFLAKNVKASTETLEAPLGTFECMQYVHTRPETRTGPAEDRYWFAYDLPGPPLRMERYAGGKLVFVMEMISAEGVRAP